MSSAANVASPGSEAQGNEAGKPRPNPVALEALVSVTGANAGQDGARHLFSEETTTVLVFKDGAVIRLGAPVSVGQLLFLTNKKSGQEVVCQVLKQRSFRAGMSYVELQFTEAREHFWGVAFPEEPKSPPEFKAPEQVQAEATTAAVSETPVAPHSEEEVDQLKEEVALLREQLTLLEKRNAEAAAVKVKADVVEAVKTPSATDTTTKSREEGMAANQPGPAPAAAPVHEQKPELLMPAARKEEQNAARAVISMALPVWKKEKSPEEQLLEEENAAKAEREAKETAPGPTHDAGEELLPEPALDFSKTTVKDSKRKSKKAATDGEELTPLAAGRARMGRTRVLALTAVLLLLLAGGAWYGDWGRYLPFGKKGAVTNAGAVRRPNPVRSAAAAIAKAVSSAKPDSSTAEKNTANDEKAEGTPDKTVEQEAAAEERRVAARERAAKKNVVNNAAATAPSAAEAVSADAPLVPAKLLKPVNPVYPPDAMRSYITGDVKAEVEVQASGRVGQVKVISGPKALRDAAVEALKQYQYAPATQGGKAVESTAVEVVKFWFNP